MAALSLIVVALAPTPAGAQGEPMKFGMNLSSIDAQAQAGVKPDLGMIWIGPWTLASGWGGPDRELEKAYASGVTPVVQFYYWGDDISVHCLENGCESGLHGARKDKAGWNELARQLAEHLNAKMKGRAVVIILETEFNKNDVTTYEPLDGYLAEKATYFREHYAGSEVVLGFGNWGREQWGTWDRAVAASHATGVQGMRGSTRNSAASYLGLAQATLDGAKALRDRFHKPIYITDVALSSHPEPDWLALQDRALRPFFDRLGEFKALGVKGLLYRSLKDSPTMDTANYFGEAERHWGLVWAGNGTHKPAMQAWVQGVERERGTPAASTPAPPPPPTFPATFTIKAPNEWWQEVFIDAPDGYTVAGVKVRKDGGAWQAMGKSTWGAWTSSYNTKAGAKVEFLATASNGPTSQSQPFTWMDGQMSKPSTGSSTPTTTTSTSAAPTASASPTPAPTPLAAPLAVSALLDQEAERFTSKSGGTLESDPSASNGQRWTFTGNGHVANGFDGAGTLRVIVYAAGQTRNTEAPQMQVGIDGQLVMDYRVTAKDFYAYQADVTVPAGRHELTIAYVNDVSGLLADRNLLVDRAIVQPKLRVEAEAFGARPTGDRIADPTASAGHQWTLWSNAAISQTLTTPSIGNYEWTVTAKGSTADGVGAHMVVRLDGDVVLETDPGPAWQKSKVQTRALAKGTHTLTVEFTNDAYAGAEDRNLSIDCLDVVRNG